MKTYFVSLVVLCLMAWLVSVVAFREHPWSFAGWFPATGLGMAGTLFLLAGVWRVYLTPGGGAAEGFFKIGLATVVLPLLFPAPLFLGLSWYVRPRVEPADGAIAVGTLGAGAGLAGVFYLAHDLLGP